MRKVIIILVVAAVVAGIFLYPLFIKRKHSILFSIPPDKIIITNSPPEIESAEEVSIKDFDLPFEKVFVLNTGSELSLYGCRTESIGVISANRIYSKPIIKWYKTTLPAGYFHQIEKTQVYSSQQILFDVGGNVGTNLFWALMSLGIGLILILLVSIWNSPNKQNTFQQATT